MDYEILPQRVDEVIDDIKKCTTKLVEVCEMLSDTIVILNTPILIQKKGPNT